MYASQHPWIELYDALLACGDDADAYDDVLEPWAQRHADERHRLADFAARTDGAWHAATNEDLWRLYAAFRVTSTLLLRFQSGRADRTDYPGPNVGVEGYQLFHEGLGFHVPDDADFHPFYHEIVRVCPTAAAAAPIEVVEQLWPPLMLGSMMFCRAGCVVSGGADHVVPAIAERSKLYWTFRRKDRPCHDLSHGWGSNSQWSTPLRRDYRAPNGAFHYNVGAREPLDLARDVVDGLSSRALQELIRNRCMIRTAIDDSDLHPYRYSFAEAG
jgi:hypothetical protein